MTEPIGIKYFVPAKALEHPKNPEIATLYYKLRWAILRYHQDHDFFSETGTEDLKGSVGIKNAVFDDKELGYHVTGFIKSG